MLTRSQSVIRYLVSSYASEDSWLGPILRAVPLNATTKQFLSLRRSEQRHYVEQLWQFNQERPSVTDRPLALSALYKIRTTAGLFRRFNQLPCTLESRKGRADLVDQHSLPSGMARQDQHVLVLGDDDLLAVELAQRGYPRVTVADCDEQLLARIAAETANCATKPNILRADFRKGLGAELAPADCVFLDPPYSIDGAVAFLKLAVAATAGAAAPRIYLMINPNIFGDQFVKITSVATRAGFEMVRQRPRFNAYPLGAIEAAMLKATWRIALRRPVPKAARDTTLFCSDCFEFVRS